MKRYHYVALNGKNSVVKGTVEAENIRDARAEVTKLGYVVTKVEEATKDLKDQFSPANVKVAGIKKLSLKERIDFTSIFHTLTMSGVPVIETLVFIENDASSKSVRQIAHEIRKLIVTGSTFADAIAKFPHIFGNVFIGLVKAGEDSGEMDKTLERVILLLKKEDAVRSKVVGALIYPCFVVCLAIIIMMVMLVFVFPEFQKMFQSLGKELPIVTQICINIGLFVRHQWYVILGVLVGIFLFLKYVVKLRTIKVMFDNMILKVPLIGELFVFANLSNFIAVMFVAYEAGIPVVDCLYLSNFTIDNVVLRRAAAVATEKVQQGMHLSTAMQSAGVFPKMLLFMISAGEQSGRLGEMLDYSTKYIDNELDKIIDSMTKLIEPFMLIVIGGLVLFMALALYLPLFESYQR